MKIGVVIFPGSNCDHDALSIQNHLTGVETVPLWHKEHDLKGVDMIYLPGGFSYGDYLRGGAIASKSPIMAEVVEFANKGGMLLGVCNGFQVLTEAGLLPGALLRNAGLTFRCEPVHLKVQTMSPFTLGYRNNAVVESHIAHGEGNYVVDKDILKELEDQKRIAFRYCDADGNITDESNPNGSVSNIAGILSENKRILGMMPHPERCLEESMGSTDGLQLFQSAVKSLSRA